ncbi:MAG: branched-chain amino acid transaminase [Candidatus Saganbacteria bacterium]|nr:branched-chain amino acid transaminase [Candidatus Saganbacteria bacterium]
MKFAFFRDKIVPMEDAKIGIMTHALNYGTGCFEGIRGYWSEDRQQMYVFQLREHYERLLHSCRSLHIKLDYTLDDLCNITVKLVRKNGYRQDVYIRPLAYKSEEKIGLGLVGIEDDFAIYLSPFGDYLDVSEGISVCVSRFRRLSEHSLPPGAKLTGVYFNSSLAKADAINRGFVEAIMLSSRGNVAEGSGENIFMVKNGKLYTPPVSEDLLPGITRKVLMILARKDLGLVVNEKVFKPKALFTADELFFCGTGAQVSPIVKVDNKKIGNGKIGEITKRLQEAYFTVVKGENPKYSKWLTPVY